MMMAVAVMVSWDGNGAAVKVVALVVMMIGGHFTIAYHAIQVYANAFTVLLNIVVKKTNLQWLSVVRTLICHDLNHHMVESILMLTCLAVPQESTTF